MGVRLSPCASEDRSSGLRFRSPARGGRLSCVAPRSVRRVIRARAEAAGAGLENPSLGRVSDHSLSACDPSESAFRLGTTLSTIGHGVQPLEPLFSMLGSRCERSEHSLRSLNQASLPILDLVRMQSRLFGKLGVRERPRCCRGPHHSRPGAQAAMPTAAKPFPRYTLSIIFSFLLNRFESIPPGTSETGRGAASAAPTFFMKRTSMLTASISITAL